MFVGGGQKTKTEKVVSTEIKLFGDLGQNIKKSGKRWKCLLPERKWSGRMGGAWLSVLNFIEISDSLV